eukprot:5769080-Heterocapsa_arctica.AAC.1
MNLACSARAAEVGNRFKGLGGNKQDISPDGLVHWGKMGAYALEFDTDGQKATRVLHRPTNQSVPVPERTQITGDYELQRDWSD